MFDGPAGTIHPQSVGVLRSNHTRKESIDHVTPTDISACAQVAANSFPEVPGTTTIVFSKENFYKPHSRPTFISWWDGIVHQPLNLFYTKTKDYSRMISVIYSITCCILLFFFFLFCLIIRLHFLLDSLPRKQQKRGEN